MGSDDIFKKKRAARKKRKKEFLEPKSNSFLIVTEGTETEPNYFGAIKRLIINKVGGAVDVVKAPVIDISGNGRGTTVLVNEVEKIVKLAPLYYQNIWIVMDKDDFCDFDEAIIEGTKKGYKVAWSNQCFEYWLFLHFQYSDSDLHRDDWENKLSELFYKNSIGDGEYHKNDKDIYEKLNIYGSVKTAISNAKRRMDTFNKKKIKPSEFGPGTMVHTLVEELLKYLD